MASAADHSFLLDVRDVSVKFGGVVALNSVSLGVEPRAVHSLVGPNGAGKTTLFNTISGLNPRASGSILLDGVEVLGWGPARIARWGVARTFQNVVLFDDLNVLDNVLLGAERLRGGKSLPRRADAIRILDEMGLAHVREESPRDLPFGLKKLVELARALISRPRLVMMDEPTAGLQEADVANIIESIRDLRNAYDITFLLVAHHMDFVMKVSDTITVLQFGEKIAEGEPSAIQANGRVIDAYLGKQLET